MEDEKPNCDYCDNRRWVENMAGFTAQQGIKDCPVCVKKIAGRTPMEWESFARRDDCLDRMVPSDLRALVSKIRL